MNLFRIFLCAFSLLFMNNATGQGLYQKSWLVDVSAGTPLLEKGGTAPIQARLSGGYEVQFTESGILGFAMRGGYASTSGSRNLTDETGIIYANNELLYSYNGNSLFAGVSPMIILEQYDSNFDRLFIELELGLASHNVDMKFYEPTTTSSSNWVHCKGYFALKAGFRLAWSKDGYFRAMSIWGSLHNLSPIDAIEKSIPKNWPYEFKEDLNAQWQVGISVYI